MSELDRFAHQARTCEGESCKQVIKEMVDTNIRNQQEMMDSCNSNPNQCAQKYGYLVDQWPVFERTLKNMGRDGTLPVEFRNYLSAVNTLGQAATGKVGELGWTKRFEAMGISKKTAAAMAMTLPIVVEGTRGAKSSPSSSKVTANSQGTNWKASEGQYSQKNQGTVTNVEHPVGKYDGKPVPKAEGKTNYPEGINFKIEQPKHLATLDGYNQKKGISGAHNADAFHKAASDNGVKIVSQTPGTVNGITHIKYQVPTKNRAGNFDGGYKKEVLEKTVYDPKVFSDKRILELGQKAAANGYRDAIASGKREYMATANGVKFQVYLDQKTGTVTNFFPVTK
ncbi:CdiA family toxin C-terminal domain-containing protein [Photorhabdus bodei]|uniref:CdiA family toxin C-terminal domain-containing protein n=1 Tax=Photorhabdus TaxID=29487 RepID=UPI00232F3494|nr:CdiA family toxin C-terminal domain-containing protein [Photorhabdus bodei]MDB6370370.1 CdiA family toxin C-terminal domain-containing protein [Photorhabdus bodei]